MDIIYALIVGLIVGCIFGFVLQRGRFCMNSAFRDILVLKDYKLIKAVLIAIFVEMIGFAIFSYAGFMTLAPKQFQVLAAIVGGFVFGIGMVLAAGCASGTTYRVGEGMMGSFVAALGLTLGAVMTKFGILNTWMASLKSITIKNEDGSALTVFGALTPIFMIIIGAVGLGFAFYKWGMPALKKRKDESIPILNLGSAKEKILKSAYPWWSTGIVIGFIGIAGYLAGGGVLGITGGWMNIYGTLTAASWLAWSGFIIMGIILGSFIAAKISGEFKLRTPRDGKTILTQFFGGIMMGFGAVTASGCNITNILGGVPQLSIHSIVVGVFIMLGSWVMAYFLFMRDTD